jgi:hypothetical protein
MSPIVYRITSLLYSVVYSLPIGTNLGVFLLLWTFLTGRLLQTRGALIPALDGFGLPEEGVRRSWASLTYGRWKIQPLLDAWRTLVLAEGQWQPHRYGGYRVVACDLIGFFRPKLQHCATKHYDSLAGKARSAIPLGAVVSVGSVGNQRLGLLRTLVRPDTNDPSEQTLKRRTLAQVAALLEQDEALAIDGGFGLTLLQEAGITRYVARMPQNFTARRNALPEYAGKGCLPKWGKVVRPLPRTFKGKTIAATPPDRTQTWEEGGLQLEAAFWDDLVGSDQKPGTPAFSCVTITDPRYETPLVLAYPIELDGAALRAFYLDRWPIEQLPLATKQMIGLHRQFVFAEESRYRLPELGLLAGSILSYAAATMPVCATGFWDRRARPTCGRLRRVLSQVHLSDLPALGEQVRKKESVTAHLPKGILGHRRQKAPIPGEIQTQAARFDVAISGN